MAAKRPRPPRVDKGRSRIIRAVKPKGLKTRQTPTFNRLTVVWVQQNGVPFNTTGFFARLSRGSTLIAVANFDNYGVVRFPNVGTLTSVSYTIRTYDESGVLFRSRTIPAGVQTYAIIG